MSSNAGQGLLTIIEDDVLLTFGQAILTFTAALDAAKADPLKMAAAWLQFQGNIAPDLFTFEATLISQVLAAINAKVTAALAKAGQPAPAPTLA